MKFYVGLHHPADLKHFDKACVSIRTIWNRKKPLICPDVILDSGAFTELNLYGKFTISVEKYANEIKRFHNEGVVNITIAVAQDYMCEPFMLEKTGLTVKDHQRLTIERYDELLSHNLPVPIMPVLQGYTTQEYVDHVIAYGDRLTQNMWVGVGSVCKRNSNPEQILEVLNAIKLVRPDLRLHGFGVKITSLKNEEIKNSFYSTDSMAWSFHARMHGRSPNDWNEAKLFVEKINNLHPVGYPKRPPLKEIHNAL